jgi:hypothetical protein
MLEELLRHGHTKILDVVEFENRRVLGDRQGQTRSVSFGRDHNGIRIIPKIVLAEYVMRKCQR